MELLRAAELLIVRPELACSGTASGAAAATLHGHLLKALRSAQCGAEQHNSILCAALSSTWSAAW